MRRKEEEEGRNEKKTAESKTHFKKRPFVAQILCISSSRETDPNLYILICIDINRNGYCTRHIAQAPCHRS